VSCLTFYRRFTRTRQSGTQACASQKIRGDRAPSSWSAARTRRAIAAAAPRTRAVAGSARRAGRAQLQAHRKDRAWQDRSRRRRAREPRAGPSRSRWGAVRDNHTAWDHERRAGVIGRRPGASYRRRRIDGSRRSTARRPARPRALASAAAAAPLIAPSRQPQPSAHSNALCRSYL